MLFMKHYLYCMLHRMVNLKVVLVLLLVCSPVKSIAEDHYDGMSNHIVYVFIHVLQRIELQCYHIFNNRFI